jgi:cytochrome c5
MLAQAQRQHDPHGTQCPGADGHTEQPVTLVGRAERIAMQYQKAHPMAGQQARLRKRRDTSALPKHPAHEKIPIAGQHGDGDALVDQRCKACHPGRFPGPDSIVAQVDLEEVAQDIEAIAWLESIKEQPEALAGSAVAGLQVTVGNEIGAHAARQAIMPQRAQEQGETRRGAYLQ